MVLRELAMVVAGFCVGMLAGAVSGATGESASPAPQPAGVEASPNRLVRDGVVVEFEARPLEGTELMEGRLAEVRFLIRDERTGKPVAGARPGAWLDIGAGIQGRAGADQKECNEKVGLYLKGAVGVRPLADLNGYYLLVMNKDPSITVIDPMVSAAGRTSTLASLQLERPPADWVNHDALKRLFVTMPSRDAVAVIDTENLKVADIIGAGRAPTRIVLQPDRKYLWVGNDAADPGASGVTVIDATDKTRVFQTATGRGHHEIVVSADNRHAFVTNRDEGTVTVVDVGALRKLKDIRTGSAPVSIAWSRLARAAYVTDARDGTISVIDSAKLEVVKRIEAKPGLGPVRFTPDGRFGLALNTAEGMVHVIDPGTNEIIQSAKVENQPFQLVFSRDFAYVRSLGSERLNMINLGSLGRGQEPIVQSFAAGSFAPKLGGDLPIADSMTAALGEAAAFVVSPAENATYFYMEGMNAPVASYQSRGKLARAVTVVDRSLKEAEPGVFQGRLRLPAAGRYDVAFSLDQPRMVHCFSAEVAANPELQRQRNTTTVDFLVKERIVRAGESVRVRFKLLGGGGETRTGLKDVRVRYFLLPASPPRDAFAKEVENGIYEAEVALADPGAYYVYVGVPSLNLGFSDLPYLSLMSKPDPAAASPGAAAPDKPAKAKKGDK